MKTTLRTEIITETHETTVVRIRKAAAREYCDACGAETMHLTAEQAAATFSLTLEEIEMSTASGAIHLTGERICGRALAEMCENR